jgi:hypothetical protein
MLVEGFLGKTSCFHRVVASSSSVTPNRRVIATLGALIARLHATDTRFCPPLVDRCDREMQDIQGNKAGRVREELERGTKYLPRFPHPRLMGLVRLSQTLTGLKIWILYLLMWPVFSRLAQEKCFHFFWGWLYVVVKQTSIRRVQFFRVYLNDNTLS